MTSSTIAQNQEAMREYREWIAQVARDIAVEREMMVLEKQVGCVSCWSGLEMDCYLMRTRRRD